MIKDFSGTRAAIPNECSYLPSPVVRDDEEGVDSLVPQVSVPSVALSGLQLVHAAQGVRCGLRDVHATARAGQQG